MKKIIIIIKKLNNFYILSLSYKSKNNKMEHITLMEKRIGADLGYHESNLQMMKVV